MVDLAQDSFLPDDLAVSVAADSSATEGGTAADSDISPSEAQPTRSQRRASRATSASPDGPADPVLATLLRLEGLVATLARVAMRPVLEEELKEPSALAIYAGTGEKTAREIASAAGVGVGTVSRTWTRWAALGLVVKDGTYRRAF